MERSCHFIFVFQDTAEHSNINGKCHISFAGEQVALEAGESKECRISRKEKKKGEWELRGRVNIGLNTFPKKNCRTSLMWGKIE